MKLPIASITPDSRAQKRREINWTVVAEYSTDMANGDTFPPIVVFHDDSDYWLSSGFHRYHAANQAGLTHIDADVRPGTIQDAIDYACSKEANGKNGMRESKEDREDRIMTMLRDHPDWSSRRIADHCGVTHPTVEARRAIWKDLPDTRTVTRNGTTYTMNIPKIERRANETEPLQPIPEMWRVAPEPLDSDEEEPLTCFNCWHYIGVDYDNPGVCAIHRINIYGGDSVRSNDGQAQDCADYTEDKPTPIKTEAPQPPHVAYNSGNNEWYTPAPYITAARAVMGSIDLDPASTAIANGIVEAETFYTAEDDGLTRPWYGNIWMNPPYASEMIGKFCEKLAQHVKSGDIAQAVVLVNNATETNWFNALIGVASAVCFPRGRVKFWNPDKESAPLQGQSVIYVGNHTETFCKQFMQFGWIARL